MKTTLQIATPITPSTLHRWWWRISRSSLRGKTQQVLLLCLSTLILQEEEQNDDDDERTSPVYNKWWIHLHQTRHPFSHPDPPFITLLHWTIDRTRQPGPDPNPAPLQVVRSPGLSSSVMFPVDRLNCKFESVSRMPSSAAEHLFYGRVIEWIISVPCSSAALCLEVPLIKWWVDSGTRLRKFNNTNGILWSSAQSAEWRSIIKVLAGTGWSRLCLSLGLVMSTQKGNQN